MLQGLAMQLFFCMFIILNWGFNIMMRINDLKKDFLSVDSKGIITMITLMCSLVTLSFLFSCILIIFANYWGTLLILYDQSHNYRP